MPKAGRRRKKTRTHVAEDETAQSALSSAEALKVPKSLVVRHFTYSLFNKRYTFALTHTHIHTHFVLSFILDSPWQGGIRSIGTR